MTKKRRGRPPLPESKRRAYRLQVALSMLELVRVRKRAAAAGKSVVEYVRELAVGAGS